MKTNGSDGRDLRVKTSYGKWSKIKLTSSKMNYGH